MKIKSKLRLILIPIMILVIAGIGNVPFSVYKKNIAGLRVYEDDGSIFWPTQILAIGILALIIFLFYRILTRTLILYIDSDLKTVTFFYPLLYYKRQYHFSEIKTFSFSFWFSRACNFKYLNFQTGDRIYRISDFEISNLRTVEKFAIENFTLSLGRKFEFLSDASKPGEIQNSIKFDIKQAKEYRISCYMLLALAIYIIYTDRFIAPPDRKIGLLGVGICFYCIVFAIDKILHAHRTIKNLS